MIRAIALPLDEDYSKKKYRHEKFATCCGEIYLHGELEKRNGFDEVLLKERPDADGIYDCAVFMGDNGACKAKLYYWVVNYRNSEWIRARGYVVLDSDTNGKAYAEKKFDERSEYL